MRLRAKPRLATSSRTRLSIATRTVSYRSRWRPVSSTVRSTSVLGGSSFATSSLRRRRMKGATRRASSSRRIRSPCFSIGVRQLRVKSFDSPRKPGSRKSNCAHSSPRWFSIGVPVRHSRWRARSRRTAFAAWLPVFFTVCASSRMSRW